MTNRAPLPPHLHGAAFHVRDVGLHAVSRGRLRGSDVQHPFTGVRSIGLDLDSTRDQCLAYEPLLRPSDAFSHETAAALLGLPLPSSPALVHVTSQPGAARARTRGAVGHTSATTVPVVLWMGLPVVSPAFVWCQLAATLDWEDLVAVGDALVTGRRVRLHRKRPCATMADLERAAIEWGSGRGARAIAWAMPRIRCGAESRPETLTRLVLVEHGFPEPVLNEPTRVGSGEILHPDMKWPEWRILLEYEGDGHRTDRAAWQRDIRRKRDFEAAGWVVIRVTSDDLFVDRAGFIARVREFVAIAEARARHR